MGFIPLDMLYDITENRYQAVLIASQRARQLNDIRLAKLEILSNDNADNIEIDGRKVTFRALKDCLEGKVTIKTDTHGEESIDS
ncbi:MAG: DNA-directed RNA polymerase subunit omega [Candidatus Zixiibacteriota bacterium]